MDLRDKIKELFVIIERCRKDGVDPDNDLEYRQFMNNFRRFLDSVNANI